MDGQSHDIESTVKAYSHTNKKIIKIACNIEASPFTHVVSASAQRQFEHDHAFYILCI